MRFDRLRLHNFKCYEHVDLELQSGVTVIHGLNGSGKSSLLEACFFALYGSKALSKNLDEVVTLGAEEMSVELWFTHASESYRIEREVTVRNGTARTKQCILDGPSETSEGATDVRRRIGELLRMDTESFVNCAYVRQGEVNKLINASPSDRQNMLDDLLQLGILEEYRERASDARVGVGRVRDDKAGALSEIDEQIEDKKAQNLHERHNERKTELAGIIEDIERFEENRTQASETLEQANSILEEYEEKRDELESLEEDINQLRKRIEDTASERDKLGERLTDSREKLSDLQSRREDLLDEIELDEIPEDSQALIGTVENRTETIGEEIDEITDQIREISVEKQEYDGEKETLEERAAELEATAIEKRKEADNLEGELTDAKELLESKREELTEMSEEIDETRERFEDVPVSYGEAESFHEEASEQLTSCREQLVEYEAELENERERLEEAIELREAGKCPECGQPVDQSPHVDAIGERRERIDELQSELADMREQKESLQETSNLAEELLDCQSRIEKLESERNNITQLLEERETNIDEKQARIERLRTEAEDHEETAESKREAAAEAAKKVTECREQIAECNKQKATLSEQLERLDTVLDVLRELTDLREKRERISDQRAQKESLNEERRERLAEQRKRRDELRDSFDSERIDEARKKRDEAREYLEQVEEKLTELEETRGEIQGKIGALENEIEQLEELETRRDELAKTVENLDSLYNEAEQLQQMYGSLRAELRQQNVETLERMLNETFDLVYENDTYARIELDGDYQLTVYQKDGKTLDPEQLSGGERAIFNLSLRCAIYRLLADGIEGTAPMPPLILDEPTVFLDSGHVSQLLELIDAMYELGVDQILVVSHDDELVAAGDDLLQVSKDSTTNRSRVERASQLQLAEATD